MHACFFVFVLVFFSTKLRLWLGRMSPTWSVLCQMERKTLTQSINQLVVVWSTWQNLLSLSEPNFLHDWSYALVVISLLCALWAMWHQPLNSGIFSQVSLNCFNIKLFVHPYCQCVLFLVFLLVYVLLLSQVTSLPYPTGQRQHCGRSSQIPKT